MAVRTRVQTIDDWVSITVDAALSPQARSRAVAGFAREKLAEALKANRQAVGEDTPYEQFVDGRKGAALESVSADRGVIVFEFELVGDVLTWILKTLIERSPRGPSGGAGTYRDAHRLFADGREAAAETIPPAEEYSFTNTVPYSRRLEIGKTQSGRDFLVSLPNRIYERTAKDAQARFGNIAKITFTFRSLVDGGAANPAARARTRRDQSSPKSHNVAKLRFPTITVRPT